MADPFLKLGAEVQRFFDIYTILSPEGKATFEAQMGPTLSRSDQNTRALYASLMGSAKEGLTPQEAIEKLKETSVKNGKTDKPGQDQNKP